MLYSLTDKLTFDAPPQIEIKGKKITVKSDAVTVLKLMDLIQKDDTTEAALQAANILFSEKDKKVIDSLNLCFKDYVTLLTAAMSLAAGEDPNEAQGE